MAPTPPPATTINDHQEYEVKQILDQCTWFHHQEFLIKWKGYPDHDATWEPEAHLKNAAELIQDFTASRMLLEGRGSNVMVLHVAKPSGADRGIVIGGPVDTWQNLSAGIGGTVDNEAQLGRHSS